MYDKYLIAPLNSGLDTSLRPWQIPEDSFARLNNAYVFRGRVKKRFGSTLSGEGTTDIQRQLNSRVKINLGATDAVTGILNGNADPAIFKVGQMFSIEDEILTVSQSGLADMLNTDPVGITVHTYNTANGAYQITALGHLNKTVYFYPSEPIMGLTMYEDGPVNNRTAFAFDTQYAYKYSGTSWIQDGPTGSQFHGNNSDFFWSSNWRGANVDTTILFTSNFNATLGIPGASDDPMWYYNGATWANFTPSINATAGVGDKVVYTARIVIPFKDRLLLLNTIEREETGAAPTTYDNKAYQNRCRFSHNGSPLSAHAFYEPNVAGATGGGYIDSTSQEEIISAMTIRDRLIVFFERSTRELVYTGNEEQPFYWQKLNTELGSEGSFSTIPFDKDLLTIGATGIHACNGVDVYRIDEKIPNKVFEINNLETGIKRIHGIRDFDSEMVYWTFPTGKFTYPERVLVFNYKNKSWAFNDDTFTCFGYFEQQSDLTWATAGGTWGSSTSTWSSGITREQHRRVIAGNQQGFILKLDSEETSNARSMQITQMATNAAGYAVLTIIDHTLSSGDFIQVRDTQGVTFITGEGIYKVIDKTATTVTIEGFYTGTYTGGGTASYVSVIDIKSKQWNPYSKEGRSLFLPKIDFCVDRTTNGEVTVDYSSSYTNRSFVSDSNDSDCSLGDNKLLTKPHDIVRLESQQDRFWHTVYFQGEGSSVQIRIYLTETQILNPDIAFADFELEGLILYTQKIGRNI